MTRVTVPVSLASGPDGCLDATMGQKPHLTKNIRPSPTSRPWGRAGQGTGTRPPPIVQHLGSWPGFLSKHRDDGKGGGATHPCHGTQHRGACGDHSVRRGGTQTPQDTGQMHVQADPPQPRASRSRKDPRLEHFVKNTAIKSRQRGCPCHQQGHTADDSACAPA